MSEHPILFSAPMVRAILDGKKSQTRRVAKKMVRHPDLGNLYTPGALAMEGEPQHVIERACPYGRPGDRLWVRETWQGPLFDGEHGDVDRRTIEKPEHCVYKADGVPAPEFIDADDNLQCCWRPSIHMPRWASRITLEITSVRVERLQDISEADAIAEGIESRADGWAWYTGQDHKTSYTTQPITSYRSLWDSINGAESWAANPWVWVVEFKRVAP